eukprot:6758676-Lingulodinium_polyedra.AAC.1
MARFAGGWPLAFAVSAIHQPSAAPRALPASFARFPGATISARRSFAFGRCGGCAFRSRF